MKKDIDELKQKQNSDNELNKKGLNDLISKFNSFENNNKDLLSKISEIEKSKKDQEEEKKEEKKDNNESQISKEQMNQILKLINDNKLKINDLQKEIQSFPEKYNMDPLKTQIDEIMQNIESVLTKSDLIPVKEKLVDQQNEIDIIKDNIQQQDEIIAKLKNDLLNFSKKIESFSGMLLMLQSDAGSKVTSSSGGGTGKGGVDPVVFSKAMMIINQQILSLQNDCNEFKRNFHEILPVLNKLSTVDDLRNLEQV